MIWARLVFWLAYAGIGVGVVLMFLAFHKGQQKPNKLESILMAIGVSVGLFSMGLVVGALLQ